MSRNEAGQESSVKLRSVAVINGNLCRAQCLDQAPDQVEDFGLSFFDQEGGEFGLQKFEQEGRGE